MSEAIRFLHALAQALSATALYSPGHPAAARAMETLWEALTTLLDAAGVPTFLLLGGAPIYDGRVLHELAAWPWGPRLSAAGIQRLEFDRSVTTAGLGELLKQLDARVNTAPDDLQPPDPIEGIRFGMVEVRSAAEETVAESDEAAEEPEQAPAEPQLDLPDELAAMAYVHAEARDGRFARSEIDVVVRILAGQLDRTEVPLLTPPESFEAYPQYLAINGALLAMAAAGRAGIDRRGRHMVGVAGLMADIGMMRLGEPFEQRDNLDGSARPLMESHTTRGATFLLETGGRGIELAATVAHEHHLRPDGNGYPVRRFTPQPHWASRLVAASLAFGSLRVARPFRPAWSPLRAVNYLEEAAGTVYDIEAARLIAALIRSSFPSDQPEV